MPKVKAMTKEQQRHKLLSDTHEELHKLNGKLDQWHRLIDPDEVDPEQVVAVLSARTKVAEVMDILFEVWSNNEPELTEED